MKRIHSRDRMPGHRSLVRVPLLEPSPLAAYRLKTIERREDHERFSLFSEGDPDPGTNFAAVFGPVSADAFLTSAERFFAGESFAILIESETGEGIEDYLRHHGWELDEEEVAMVLTPVPDPEPPPPGLRIDTVATEAAYEDFMTVVPGNRFWVPSLAAATDPNVSLFVGYIDDEPVVTSRLVCYGEIGEVTAVQTLDSHRRRGYGRALTRAAIAEAGRRGCTAVILTATEMGYPLYLRMGFEEVCAYRTYLQPLAKKRTD